MYSNMKNETAYWFNTGKMTVYILICLKNTEQWRVCSPIICTFVVWVLVQFDDQVFSIDILQNLENDEGETGENMDLTERARCMAEYNKEYYPATVICI